jgi:hypothetical protein
MDQGFMPFSVEFPLCSTEEVWEGQRVMFGRITLGNFTEEFAAYLDYWSSVEYEAQWKEAVCRIISGASIDALITDMHDLKTAHHLVSWPMYREGNRVFIQNRLLFLNDLGRPSQLEHAIAKLGERKAVNHVDAQISEWSATVNDLEVFIDRLPSR